MGRVVLAVVLVAAVGSSAALLAGQSAPVPNVPGMPTLARMLVINGASEPVPVVVADGGRVQPVTVIGTPSVLMAPDSVVTTRQGRQGWEYRVVPMPSAEDAAALNAAGLEGWEAVGVTNAAAGGSQVLLKRPR
jgi:hypothetical protein